MLKIRDDDNASAVPIVLFLVTIFGCGALYTLLFIQFGIGFFGSMVPASDSKTFILMLIYAMPLLVLMIGMVSLIREGLKRSVM